MLTTLKFRLFITIIAVELTTAAFADPQATAVLVPDDTVRIWVSQPDSVIFLFDPFYNSVFTSAPTPCRGIAAKEFQPVSRDGQWFGGPIPVLPKRPGDEAPCETTMSRISITLPVIVKDDPGINEIRAHVVFEDRDTNRVYGVIDSIYSLPVIVKDRLRWSDGMREGNLISDYLRYHNETTPVAAEPETIRVRVDHNTMSDKIITFPTGNRYYVIEHEPTPSRYRIQISDIGLVGKDEAEFKLVIYRGPEGMSGGVCRARFVDGRWIDFVFIVQFTS